MPDGGGRLLRIREGHGKPPTKIRFYGSLGNNILSAGDVFLLSLSLNSFSGFNSISN